MSGPLATRPARLPVTFTPLTIGEGVRAQAARVPDKIAAVFGEQTRSYGALMRRADAATNAVIGDLGLKPGDHAAIIAGNCIEYLEIVVGVPEAGVAVATINPRATTVELESACDDACAKVIFTDAQSAPAVRAGRYATVERIIEIGPDYEAWLSAAVPVTRPTVEEWDVWTIPYTSGTTGRPKGVLLSHRSRSIVSLLSASEFGCFGSDDRYLAMTPMNHGGGLAFPIATLLTGGTVDIMDRFDAATVLKKFKFEGITGVFMVPTHFHSIFDLPEDLLDSCRRPGLKTIIANAAPLPQAMKEKIVPYFGETVLNEIYGATEMGLITNLRPPYQLTKLSCVGLPFAETRVRILDDDGRDCAAGEVGEIFCRSPQMFNGYWNRDEETAATLRDGWVSVGDMGRQDEDGFLYIVDRKKDMVISGGVNIYPREIEDVLFKHPAISDVSVVGVPDERWGERLKAFAVLKAEASLSVEEVLAFCQDKLAAYKIPRELQIIDALPRNANGKVLKRELRNI